MKAWKKTITGTDAAFLRGMCIAPSVPADLMPQPVVLPAPQPPIIHLSAKDAKFLEELKVCWEPEEEPGFTVPATLREYLERYPNGIKEAVHSIAREFNLTPIGDFLDDMAQDVIVSFLRLADPQDMLEDIVEMYITVPTVAPGADRSIHFHGYIRMRVAAMMQTILKNNEALENPQA